MPIVSQDQQAIWDSCVEANKDPYGKACMDVARRVMEILDAEPAPIADIHALVSRADDETKVGGITGFMAGCVARMVSQFHSRGEEFRKLWNKDYGVDESEKGVVNPAILTVKLP